MRRVPMSDEDCRRVASAALKTSLFWDDRAEEKDDAKNFDQAAACRSLAKDYETLWLKFSRLIAK